VIALALPTKGSERARIEQLYRTIDNPTEPDAIATQPIPA